MHAGKKFDMLLDQTSSPSESLSYLGISHKLGNCTHMIIMTRPGERHVAAAHKNLMLCLNATNTRECQSWL